MAISPSRKSLTWAFVIENRAIRGLLSTLLGPLHPDRLSILSKEFASG